ncbi:hypothetical protein GGR09_001735 [Bartonella heixiaziensis]
MKETLLSGCRAHVLRYISRLAVFVSLSSDDDPKPSGDLQKSKP